MKKLCPECKTRFDIKLEDYEEGDAVNCPDCNLEFTIISDNDGKMKLTKSKMVEMEELDEVELNDGEDYDFD